MRQRADTEVAQSETEMVVERVVDAPIARIWSAWTDAAQLKEWFFPYGCRMENPSFDVRPGGAYSCDYIGEDTGNTYRMRGVFERFEEPNRLVMTHGWADEAGVVENDTRITVTFKDVGGRTLITICQVGLKSDEARASHSEGWNWVLDRLADRFSGARAKGH